MKQLRQYGWHQPAISEEPGINSRLDPIQAAILRVKLSHLEEHNKQRRSIAKTYRTQLKNSKRCIFTARRNRNSNTSISSVCGEVIC